MPCAGQHLVLQGVHARRRFIDAADERDRTLQNRLQPLPILNPRLRIFVLDHQVRVGDVEIQQLARGQLMIQPVDRAVLQIRKRIVPGRARQFVFSEHGLLLPRVDLIGRVRRRLAIDPVAALACVCPPYPHAATPSASMTCPFT